MRLRSTRGVRKRYVEEPIDFGDDEDEEPTTVPEDKSKDGDFEAEHEEAQAEDDDDKEEEGDLMSEDEDASGNAKVSQAQDDASQSKKQRNTGAGMIQSRKGFHDIPHYPLETRIVTRVYAGPLRRYARYSALRDAMYGPEYERIKVIWDLEIRWSEFPVLPPRFPPEDQQGVIPSPWLPPGFERGQVKRALAWYDDLQASAPQTQQSRVLSPDDGRRFVPKAEGDIVTLVGPWNKQKEVRLGQGDSVAVSPTGLPVNHPDAPNKTPSGWMLDTGGIPLAVSWAPLSRQDIQILAVATVPFSDQQPPGEDGPREDVTDKTAGCVQLWEFVPGERHQGQLPSPSTQLPRLLNVKCFNWGRPKRLQFCPVALDSSGLYGLLALLTGDGIARVIDTKVVENEDVPLYGTLGLGRPVNVSLH